MFKYILVPATGQRTDGPVFDTALAVGRTFAAHLAFLHVGIDVEQVSLAMLSGEFAGGTDIGAAIESLQQTAARERERAEWAFREFCTKKGLPIRNQPDGETASAEWLVEVGAESSWLATHGRTADLLVLGRAREGQPVAMSLLEAALIETGRPVLLAPAVAPAEVGRVVAIAWKDTRETSRAISVARPFIRRAQRVIVLCVAEDGRTEERSYERLRHALSWHNPNTKVRQVDRRPEPAAETLLVEAAGQGADLLVMGGYSHSRLREVILGGATRRILHGANLPVLMAH
jgi:nucleotide-binding universal stress UspA family protein